MDYIIEEARVNNGMNIVTADNYADGIYLLQNVAEREPERAAEVERLLAMQSGCPAGGRACERGQSGERAPLPLLAEPDNRQYSGAEVQRHLV